jgi:hypothetical protein
VVLIIYHFLAEGLNNLQIGLGTGIIGSMPKLVGIDHQRSLFLKKFSRGGLPRGKATGQTKDSHAQHSCENEPICHRLQVIAIKQLRLTVAINIG